jgi:transposase-like protein
MDHGNVIERTALELIKLYRQLSCSLACGLGARGNRRGDDAAGDNGTATRSVVEIAGAMPWLWRMADQPGVLDSRCNKSTAKRLLRKLLERQRRMPRVIITDKLDGESVTQQEPTPCIEHRRHKGSAIGRKSSPAGIMARTGQMKRFTSARQAQHFLSARNDTNNLFHSTAITADDAAVVNNGEPSDAHVSRRYG